MINKYFLAKMNIPAYLKKFLYVNSESEHEELPDGYTHVEYLESTGTQYINTGFKPTGNTKVKIKVQLPTQTNVQQGIFGVRPGDTARFGLLTGTRVDALRVNYNTGGALGGTTTAIPNFNATNVNEIEVSNKLIVNDVFVREVNKTSFQSSVNLYLFANNNLGTPQFEMQGKIWYCKIWDNDVLVRNFIPCINPSNIAGMYDTVNDVFYANAGTGSFNVGPNLFDKNNLNYIAGYLSVNGNKIESSSKTDTYYIECNPNTTYILQREKVKTSGQVFRFASYSEVPTYNNHFTGMVGGLTDDLTLTITTGANDKYLAFSMGNVLHTDTEYIDKIQILQM